MDADYFKKLQAVPPFAAAATALQTGDLFSDLTGAVTAPVLYSYVWWCLQQAIHDQVDTLYFLARDGHILYEIAKRFCEQYALPIHCQYLYVSRMALRMPAYHRMGEAAYDLLLVRGANLTPRHVLERLALSAEEQQQVYADCSIPAEDCDKALSVQAFTAFAEQLRKSSVYRNFVQEKSQAAETAAMVYLEQAGLLRDVRLGIVDSGWNGSMQNCLMTLLEGAGKPLPNLKGYYFGLYTEPKQGTWEAWYFDPLTPLKKVIRFNKA